MTRDEVLKIHAEQVALGRSASDAVMSTRTLVHERLQAEKPMPCTSLPPDMQSQRDRRTPLTYAEKAAHVAHQRSQVTSEQHEAFARAKASGDRNAAQCADAHHHVQMLHGTSLWEETDRLCKEAGVMS